MGAVFWIMTALAYVMVILIAVLIYIPITTLVLITIIFFTVAYFLGRRIGGGWKTDVEIYERRGDIGHVLIEDKYRHVKKPEGEEYGELKKAKVRIKPVDYSFIERTNTGKFRLKMVCPAKNEYHPVKLDTTTNKLMGTIDPYFINLLTTENKRAVLKWQKQGLLDKLIQYLPIIMIMFTCIVVLVIFTDQMSRLLEPFISTANNMATAAQSMAEAVKILNNTGVFNHVQ